MTLLFALSMRATRAAITEIGTPAGAASMGLVGKPPINRFGFIDGDEGGASGFCAWCCATCCLSCGTIGIVVYWIVVFVSGTAGCLVPNLPGPVGPVAEHSSRCEQCQNVVGFSEINDICRGNADFDRAQNVLYAQ